MGSFLCELCTALEQILDRQVQYCTLAILTKVVFIPFFEHLEGSNTYCKLAKMREKFRYVWMVCYLFGPNDSHSPLLTSFFFSYKKPHDKFHWWICSKNVYPVVIIGEIGVHSELIESFHTSLLVRIAKIFKTILS